MKRKHKMDQQELLAVMYDMYEQPMYAIAYSILHSVQQAEDAVQDSFLKLIQYLPTIQKPDSMKTKGLVKQIVRTTAIDQYRKNYSDNEHIAEQKIAAADMQEQVVAMPGLEEQSFVKDLLKTLPEDYLEVIKLRSYYGFSTREAAQILSISEANVCKRMERAKKLIRNKMEEEDLENERKGYGTVFSEYWERSAKQSI